MDEHVALVVVGGGGGVFYPAGGDDQLLDALARRCEDSKEEKRRHESRAEKRDERRTCAMGEGVELRTYFQTQLCFAYLRRQIHLRSRQRENRHNCKTNGQTLTSGGGRGIAAVGVLAVALLGDDRQERAGPVPLGEARRGGVRGGRVVVEQPFLRGLAEPLGRAPDALLERHLCIFVVFVLMVVDCEILKSEDRESDELGCSHQTESSKTCCPRKSTPTSKYYAYLGLVAEQLSGLGDVGAGAVHVPRLVG